MPLVGTLPPQNGGALAGQQNLTVPRLSGRIVVRKPFCLTFTPFGGPFHEWSLSLGIAGWIAMNRMDVFVEQRSFEVPDLRRPADRKCLAKVSSRPYPKGKLRIASHSFVR
jgi:hypothetical protein